MARKRVLHPLIVVVGRPWGEDEFDVVRAPQVIVGRPWKDDDVAIHDDRPNREARTRVATWLGAFFALITGMLAVYAVGTSDGRLVSEVYGLAGTGLLTVLTWACGPSLLKMISGIRFDDADDQKK